MLKIIYIFIISFLFAACSTDKQFNGLSSKVTGKKSENATGPAEGDDEEEITAVPPSVISGSYLVCDPESGSIVGQTMSITCHLELEGEIISDYDLLDTDILITDDNGEYLPINLSKNPDHSYSIEIQLNEPSHINISLKSISGHEANDLETNTEVIVIDEIAKFDEPQVEEKDERVIPASIEPGSPGMDHRSEGPAEASAFCKSISPGAWILVPGDENYVGHAFCVMKYEAKCSLINGEDCTANKDNESPISLPRNSPWVNINQIDAMSECASLGDRYHLMTNDEWMTIGANVAGVETNWSSGAVGQGRLISGHTDNSPAAACAASLDDSLNVVEGSCLNKPKNSDDFTEQRTLTLSNGEVIWDLPGNILEWTSYFNNSDKPLPLGNKWNEYPDVTGSNTMLLTDLIPQIAINGSWSSDESIGKMFPHENGQGGALIRGGGRNGGINAGMFSALLNRGRTEVKPYIGFRCVASIPSELQ